VVLGIALVGLAGASELEKAVDLRTRGNRESAQSQQRIDRLSDETDALLNQYRSELQQVESLRVYNRQLGELVSSQEREMESLRQQIENVTVVGRQVTPLMLRMVDALEAFVELDVPFLAEERRARVAVLRELMGRADVTDAEKYRRILEAYQIENDYGRNLGAYRGELDIEGEIRTVEFLRLGRLVLIYQTLDAKEMGVWDQKQGQWVPLPATYRSSIRKGIRIALRQAAPDMMRVPVPAPEDAR
jgi:hypothetical protein